MVKKARSVTFECRFCGVEFSYEYLGGRFRHHCSEECRVQGIRKPPAPVSRGACEECGAEFVRKRGLLHLFCSTLCKSRNYVASGKAKRQSPEARSEAMKVYAAKRRAEEVEQMKVDGTYKYCAHCGGDMNQNSTYCMELGCREVAAEVVRLHRNAKSREHQLIYRERTGLSSSQRYKDRPYNKDYNYRERYPDRAKHYDHMRRALMANCERESFPDSEIFERDEYVCGICHEPVDRKVKYPDPMSSSLDHIIPLSRGGGHTRANVRLAHMGCNARKNARLDEEMVSAS